ncbi:NtaA/SnaA/SoxA family monooxygenase [Arthrobacter crystallopoietes BAB-32]|uniref:NtaA/SnaA/SoxA family monooxygenase n=1 Tax=Arthrobacter crystallopoietes BAB-32 TaxID=1246476 RepID=N1V435_9MICC|nr:LLM class flavin-dependent oxidoreductase [Arthrobacter crystallopoietes]EMY33018.1 NtaA/SnaA/SoxA family monooxygenase [Arthrobacter crystallopoietes BAB-32]
MQNRPLSLFAFDVVAPAHLTAGSWRTEGDQGHRYTDLNYWTETARLLESAGFDGIFFADTVGYHDVYEGKPDAALRDAAQFPVNDPLLMISAMAAATRHLTFGVTCSLTYEQPYLLARRFSTLDHLTRGRIGWNIVTSYSESAARNLGLTQQLGHDERYEVAEEYMDVVYKLWESSWESDAVVRDTEGRTYVEPSKVHPIEHTGKYYSVEGFHLCEPSPQRTPVLFQAGASSRGMAFAGKHAEAVFINTVSIDQARRSVEKIRQAAADAGRDPHDVKVIVLLTVVVAPTDEEARKKYDRSLENVTIEGALARFGGWTGVDLSSYDPNTPLQSVETKGVQSVVDMFSKADPDREWTPREIAQFLGIGGTGSTIVGSPDTVASELKRWRDEAGVDGINLSYTAKPGGWQEFIELALPELRRQGLIAERAEPEEPLTLREKFYGPGTMHTAHGHPATDYRMARAAVPAGSR